MFTNELVLSRVRPEDRGMVAFGMWARVVHILSGVALDFEGWTTGDGVWNKYWSWIVISCHMNRDLFALRE